jgi:hypothetical protein
MGVISTESQNWLSTIFLPGMVKHLNGKHLIHVQLVNEARYLFKDCCKYHQGQIFPYNEGHSDITIS